MPAPARDRTLALAGVWLAGAWAAWHGAAFAWTGMDRHRAESAWFIFAAVLLVAGALAVRSAFAFRASADKSRAAAGAETSSFQPSRGPSVVAALGFIAFSLLLYGRVLGVGLLSDDFVLLDRAGRLAWFDSSWAYVRPLPLALWWLASWTSSDAMLHAINIVMHGINAWLVSRIAIRLQVDSRAAILAGVVFASWPTQVEAVAWASGVFDVAMTCVVLLAVLNILHAERTTTSRIARGIALALAAIACKETAAALPILLVTLLPLLPSSARRDVLRIAAATAAVMTVYLVVRSLSGLSLPVREFPSGYELKEMLSRPFGAIGLNLHADAAVLIPVLPLVMAVEWPVMLAWIATSWPRDARSFHFVLSAAAWLLVSVSPLVTMFFVGADLQQSRYLYLGSTIWSLGMVAAAARRAAISDLGSSGIRTISGFQIRYPLDPRSAIATAFLILIAMNAGLVIMQQRRWIEAAAVRDQVVRAFVDQAIACDPRKAEGLPDNVGGAYVFRNGFPQAVARSLPAREVWEPCIARWDGARFVRQQFATSGSPAARPPLSSLPRRD